MGACAMLPRIIGQGRAAELLQTEAKIDLIARDVGYQNPFVFSTTFKRVMGWPPSTFPGRAKLSS